LAPGLLSTLIVACADVIILCDPNRYNYRLDVIARGKIAVGVVISPIVFAKQIAYPWASNLEPLIASILRQFNSDATRPVGIDRLEDRRHRTTVGQIFYFYLFFVGVNFYRG
jgi:hypothetical protein